MTIQSNSLVRLSRKPRDAALETVPFRTLFSPDSAVRQDNLRQPLFAANSFFLGTPAALITLLIRLDWVRRSIRPPARGNHEYVDWFGIAMELWIQHGGRVRQIRAPNGAVHEWRVKHQVGNPVGVTAIIKVLLFRHHVGHGSRLQGRQPLLYECLHAFEDLRFGLTGQDHLCPFYGNWQDRPGSRRIEADRPSSVRVPKTVGTFALEWTHPISFHHAHETVLALDSDFVTMPPENHNLGIP